MSYNEEKIKKATEASDEQVRAISTILTECGIEKIDSITYDELLNNANVDGEYGYRINAYGLNNIILYTLTDNTVNIIRYMDINFYADNTVLDNLSNYYATSDEVSFMNIRSTELVKSVLKAPSTAKFPSILKWAIWKDKGILHAQSYVDSQNSFGAMIRSEFYIMYNPVDREIVQFVFDGEEIIKKE